MPREKRLISFDTAEVYQAIYSLCSQKNMLKPPAGTVTDLSYNQSDSSLIVMKTADNVTGKKSRNEYSRDFMAAALMLYCRGIGIPLPKNANKSVTVKDGEVLLIVRI